MRMINSLVFIGAFLFLFGLIFPLTQATSQATEISEQAANVADKKTEIAQEEADLKKEAAERHVLIEGHTDNIGPETYNLNLSQERAAAVRSFLLRNGIDPEGITARGYGEAYPAATNTTQEGRQENRRVEIVVLREGRRVTEVMR